MDNHQNAMGTKLDGINIPEKNDPEALKKEARRKLLSSFLVGCPCVSVNVAECLLMTILKDKLQR